MIVRACLVVAFSIVMALAVQQTFAFPVDGNQTTLPAGSELNEDALDLPREVFHSEAMGGRRSHLVNLGDMAFNAPSILGRGAAGRDQLRHVPRQRRIKSQTIHPGDVDPARQF